MEARLLADAVRLASDLALFAPSASGSTAIDRLARQGKPANRAEAVALDALRAASLRLMRIQMRESRDAVRLQDLASGETLNIVDDLIPNAAIGLSVLGRVARRFGRGFILIVAQYKTPLATQIVNRRQS